MAHTKTSPTPLCINKKLYLGDNQPFDHPSLYHSKIGALQYLTHSRPDISFVVSKLSQFLPAPTVTHWSACKRVLRYVKGTLNLVLSFRPAKVLNLEGFVHVDWASNIDDRKSMSGICIFLGGNLSNWSAKKQASMSRSSIESEYRALALAAIEVVWVLQLLQELQVPLQSSDDPSSLVVRQPGCSSTCFQPNSPCPNQTYQN